MAYLKDECRACNGSKYLNYFIYLLDEYLKSADNWCVNCADSTNAYDTNCFTCSSTTCTVNDL